MSRWTHVAGLIRIDSVSRQLAGVDWVPLLQHELTRYELPSGSEGPIEFRIADVADENSMSRGWLAIWGDLRDFGEKEDVESILRWLRRVFWKDQDHPHYWVRQGFVQVEDMAGSNSCVFLYCGEDGWLRLGEDA